MTDHNILLTDNAYASHVSYWTQQTKNLTNPFRLESMKTGLSITPERAVEEIDWSKDSVDVLEKLSRGKALEWYVIVYAGLAVTLSRHTGSSSLSVASPLFHQGGVDSSSETVVPLLTTIPSDFDVKQLIIQSNQAITQAYKYQNFPLSALSKAISYNAQTNILLIFSEIHSSEMDLDITTYDVVIRISRKGLSWEYNTAHCYQAFVQHLHTHCDQVLKQFADVTLALSELKIPFKAERREVLESFNPVSNPYPSESVVELFERQVMATPDAPALVLNDIILSYGELNRRANYLAHHLREQESSKPNEFIGLLLERSEWMIVAIWGILKSGAAYLPMEPSSPLARRQLMLDDANANLVLTDASHQHEFSNSLDVPSWFAALAERLLTDEGKLETNPILVNQPDDLIYVMFTSGSTGKPKGVLAEHRGVVRLVKNTQYSDIKTDDRILQLSNYAFDGSTYDIFGAHLNGAALCLLESELLFRLPDLCQYIGDQHINRMFITTALFNKIIDTDPKIVGQFDKIYFGGQDASLEHVKTALAHRKNADSIVHVYGPTENTTFSSYYVIPEIKEGDVSIPIGHAIGHSQMYILDEQLNPLPIHAEGDLYVSGDGLARGYLNQPQLTDLTFIPHPFSTGKRLYKTGDRGYWREDGVVVFAGRKDSQVKIRGFRVELGEVENNLLRHPSVEQAYVTARVNEHSNKELVAYIVGRNDVMNLRSHLSECLPEYMVPGYFITLESLPLNPNGKVDHAALPDIEVASVEIGETYRAPVNEAEQHLVEVWESVLGRNRIGVIDNYYALGGDSIKAIQIAARLHQVGLKLEVQDIFRHQTIEEIAKKIAVVKRSSEQEAITGEVILTPIQRWFFQNYHGQSRHHFNQSVLLQSSQRVDFVSLQTALKALLAHHDALRMRYQLYKEEVVQINGGLEETLSLSEVNLIDSGISQIPTELLNEVQQSLDIETGPLFKAVLYHLNDKDYLLIVIHHLVIDGVSWRIFGEDLELAYRQVIEGGIPELPAKTDSFQCWSQQLKQYSQSEELLKQREYWNKIVLDRYPPLKTDGESIDESLEKNSKTISFSLSKEDTRKLLEEVNDAYRTEINDILLTGLAQALYAWQGRSKTLIALEGHGREAIVSSMNISRTIGWFTTLYPVCLSLSSDRDIAYQLKSIKDNLHNIPQKGIGYGVLDYLCAEKEIKNNFGAAINYNYLGQFESEKPNIKNNRIWGLSGDFSGETCHPNTARLYELEITGLIKNNSLVFDVMYDKNRFNSQSVNLLIEHYRESLLNLIEHCTNADKNNITPSDVDYDGFSVDDLDELLNEI